MKTPLSAVYSKFTTSFLRDVYAQGPSRLRLALNGLSRDDLVRHPRPGKWSILEVTAHLADSELVGAVRFRMTSVEREAILPAYDQVAWATQLGYQQFTTPDLTVTLDLFENLRLSSLRVFTTLAEPDWQRTARHPERGPMTMRQLLELYADHGERHIEQIVGMRKLIGKPVSLSSLLPDRLY